MPQPFIYQLWGCWSGGWWELRHFSTTGVVKCLVCINVSSILHIKILQKVLSTECFNVKKTKGHLSFSLSLFLCFFLFLSSLFLVYLFPSLSLSHLCDGKPQMENIPNIYLVTEVALSLMHDRPETGPLIRLFSLYH